MQSLNVWNHNPWNITQFTDKLFSSEAALLSENALKIYSFKIYTTIHPCIRL